ncbi:uncharacterized protein [Diabrotica undecimpunctata]|uniref:uncharacterized protein n=1 Tax=Diabrotica undecimpunctata TaxID=50387 RepID=UPI003B637D6D
MAAELENRKKTIRVLRAIFTRTANELEGLMKVESLDYESIEVSWELLKCKFDELQSIDSQITELSFESSTETELEAEIESCDVYLRKFSKCRTKYNKLIEETKTEASRRHSAVSQNTDEPDLTGMRKFRLPTIEFKKYDGSIKGWLAFWAQFKRIHEDDSIDCHDKIEYLIQATVPGSRAHQLVESYPVMADNYSKIMESMQSRFGREDLQIEVYIRELLKLILSKFASKQKIDISKLYDSIETQLRALETLGITSDKCSAMLFPLIESCLPQELLRVWQRSTNIDCRDGTLENRLKLLMTFLRNEVENEQRIVLAAEGFGLSEEVASSSKASVKKSSGFRTAANLINCEICEICEIVSFVQVHMVVKITLRHKK